MKIWKIVFVLLTAFSLASCDKEDENNMMLTAIESIASTQWSLNRQATHREGKTVIEKFDTESAYRYVYDFRETDYQRRYTDNIGTHKNHRKQVNTA